ncbi:alpha/beta fold hydrolase [Amycolatopsis sp. NPDC005232]|uniref:alpha/beta fold hydrolase n=1 Tax=Amycolatopsis sp. NPDC005232 TaxID=3157027 RepID=UPI0033A48D37
MAEPTVFVHGFLDDHRVWDGVVGALPAGGEYVAVDLAGSGDRAAEAGPFTYDRFTADVLSTVDAIGGPFLLVGHSMGSAVAELVAAARPELTSGLVLVNPVPLAGTRLPDEAVEPFRSLGEAGAEAQRTARANLSPNLSAETSERIGAAGLRLRPEVVRAFASCWNNGAPEGHAPSGYPGPVLIVRGGDDPFVTADLVAGAVAPRFAAPVTEVVAGAGHWTHAEAPARLAELIAGFAGGQARGWAAGFSRKTADAFGETFAEDVVLEAGTLLEPVEGRENVQRVMAAASGIYESLKFTHQTESGERTYLEWEAVAFGGATLLGVTVLTKDEAGRIVHAAIHHRPLGGALKFSAELGRRLPDLAAAHFHQEA